MKLKRILAIVLSLVMLLGVMPTAFADNVAIALPLGPTAGSDMTAEELEAILGSGMSDADKEAFLGSLEGSNMNNDSLQDLLDQLLGNTSYSGTCGESLMWTLTQSGTLTISGNGDMEDYSWDGAPWKGRGIAIKKLVLEEGVKTIGEHAFCDCTQLSEVSLPKSLWTISEYAFYGCESLNKVELPKYISAIEHAAFGACNGLREVHFSGNYLNDRDAIVDRDAFTGVENITAYYPAWNISWVPAKGNVEGIAKWLDNGSEPYEEIFAEGGDDARWELSNTGVLYIYGYGELTENDISWKASSVKSYIKSVVMTPDISNLPAESFMGFASLSHVVLPNKLEKVGENAFAGCTSLKDIYFAGDAPEFEGDNVFSGVTATVFYPAGNASWESIAGKNLGGNITWLDDGSDDAAEIVATGKCGENLTWTVNKVGTLVVSGTGAMDDYGMEIGWPSWLDCGIGIRKVIFDEGVTYIGESTFDAMVHPQKYRYQQIESVSIADSVTAIGAMAFARSGIEEINIPNGLAVIANGTFFASGIKNIVIPDSVVSIESGAFYYSRLESVKIPASVEYIGEEAFLGSQNLEKIYFEGEIAPEIAENAFAEDEATVYYTPGHASWDGIVGTNFGGNLTWVAMNESCDHSYVAIVTAPTCTEGGYTTYSCTLCGDSYVGDQTVALGHSWDEGKILLAPTEKTEGIVSYSCTRCGEKMERILDKLEHVHSYTSVITAPTCDDMGYTTHSCACGYTVVDSYTDTLDHAWSGGKLSVEATEEKEGLMVYTCTRCGEKREEVIPKVEHIHVYSDTVVAPECEKEGYTLHSCRCGESYKDAKVEALVHKWDDGAVTKEPTREEDGEKTFTCSVCGGKKTESIEKLPPLCADKHKWDKGTVILEATEKGEGEMRYVCTECGEEKTEAIAKLPSVDDFKDIVTGDYFYTPVKWALAEGITNGVSSGEFKPAETCTRAQVVTFLWRAAGEPAPRSAENPFTDIKKGEYYYDAVLWAVENGITTGVSESRFAPDQGCTRAQVVSFLWRAAGKPQVKNAENPFADVNEEHYFYDAVLWAVENGITTGVNSNTFAPGNKCTRGQIVSFLYRAFN